MKNLVLVFIFLLSFSYSKSQQYTQNISFDSTLSNVHYISNDNCAQSMQSVIQLDSTLFNYVDSIVFLILIDSVNFPGPMSVSPVQSGDTITLDSTNPNYSMFSISGLEFWYRIKLIGIPKIANQIYPCKIELEQCTCFCENISIKASTIDTSLCNVDASNSLNKLANINLLNVYPNPASNQLNLALKDSPQVLKIFITNNLSEIVYQKDCFKSNSVVINTTDFKNGLYFLKLTFENNKSYYSKFVIQR